MRSTDSFSAGDWGRVLEKREESSPPRWEGVGLRAVDLFEKMLPLGTGRLRFMSGDGGVGMGVSESIYGVSGGLS